MVTDTSSLHSATALVISGGYALSIAPAWTRSYTTPRQNFVIICAFGVGFLAAYFFLTERNAGKAGEAIRTSYKQGTKLADTQSASADTTDIEKAQPPIASPSLENTQRDETHNETKEQPAAPVAPVMTDTFSWQHINYTVPMPDGSQRQLLDDISGFVAPGKLTALMGESGAGKVSRLTSSLSCMMTDGAG